MRALHFGFVNSVIQVYNALPALPSFSSLERDAEVTSVAVGFGVWLTHF